MPESFDDPVSSPSHYNKNGIEVIDVIETYAKSDFRLANVIKYVCRCEYKGKKLQDLQKAAWYLNRVIEELEDEQFVHPSPDRIPGDDDSASSLKSDYYDFDPEEDRGCCTNCGNPIGASQPYLTGRGFSYDTLFCSNDCIERLRKFLGR